MINLLEEKYVFVLLSYLFYSVQYTMFLFTVYSCPLMWILTREKNPPKELVGFYFLPEQKKNWNK